MNSLFKTHLLIMSHPYLKKYLSVIFFMFLFIQICGGIHILEVVARKKKRVKVFFSAYSVHLMSI